MCCKLRCCILAGCRRSARHRLHVGNQGRKRTSCSCVLWAPSAAFTCALSWSFCCCTFLRCSHCCCKLVHSSACDGRKQRLYWQNAVWRGRVRQTHLALQLPGQVSLLALQQGTDRYSAIVNSFGSSHAHQHVLHHLSGVRLVVFQISLKFANVCLKLVVFFCQ
jgi:hypothetical protein